MIGKIMVAILMQQAVYTSLPQVLAKDMAGKWEFTRTDQSGSCRLRLTTVADKKTLLLVDGVKCRGGMKDVPFNRLGVGRGTMGAYAKGGGILGSFLLHNGSYVFDDGRVRMKLTRLG